ncbi:MAG: hypothetical protein P8Z68_00300, partial [Kineosporiaceae bacterium]
QTGLITPEQGEALAADLAASPAPASASTSASAETPGQRPIAVEALGHLGGVLVLVALILVTGEVGMVGLPGRGLLAVTAGATAGLIAVGAAVPGHRAGPGGCLRSATWGAAVPAVALAGGVLAEDILARPSSRTGLAAAAGTAAVVAAPWRQRHRRYRCRHIFLRHSLHMSCFFCTVAVY